MRTLLNSSRDIRSRGQLSSSEYALIQVGTRTELGQNLQGSYNRTIKTVVELGSPNVMWLGGIEQGQATFQRLVGSKGFFDGWDGDECGVISPVAINLGGGPCVAAASGGLAFADSMFEGFNFSLQAGVLEISEGCTIRFGSMKKI